MVVVGIGLFTFGGYQLVTGEVERMGVAGALAAHQITQWAPLLPPVAAQRAVVEAQAGNWLASLAMLGGRRGLAAHHEQGLGCSAVVDARDT